MSDTLTVAGRDGEEYVYTRDGLGWWLEYRALDESEEALIDALLAARRENTELRAFVAPLERAYKEATP